jgi:hypothetical protein
MWHTGSYSHWRGERRRSQLSCSNCSEVPKPKRLGQALDVGSWDGTRGIAKFGRESWNCKCQLDNWRACSSAEPSISCRE